MRIFLAIGLSLVSIWSAAETNVYFGDLHLHTRYSNDAIAFMGTTRTPDEAYRFARGEAVDVGRGRTVRIEVPLDFLAVTEHTRFLGALQSMTDADSPYRDSKAGRLINSNDPRERAMAFLSEIAPWGRPGNVSPSEGIDVPARAERIWRLLVDSADRHNQPGRFTTFAAYEWTSEPKRPLGNGPIANMHRVVLFADTNDLPFPFSAVDSVHPERLWEYLEENRRRGIDAIAIPHNMNISDGLMYAAVDSYNVPLTEHYAARRQWNEPVGEVTQQKGTSETHPLLSPEDEFAEFELRRNLFGSAREGRLTGSYVRDAYKRGIEYQAWGFFNPFQFGMVGASDYHWALSTMKENRVDEDPEQAASRAARPGGRGVSVGGLTGVWAETNDRASLFSAMRRRETFATTGTRIAVRFFASQEYPLDLTESRDWVSEAYDLGVPMGAVLVGPEDKAPRFAVSAAKDPNGANLDRIQIIKGWVENGSAQERIYDVALSDNRQHSGADGEVPAVGNTVDLVSGTYTNDIGASTLTAVWEDPDFDAGAPAFYYVRVLEIPTPRWQVYDAVAAGVPLPDGVPTTIQERAFTSPIWYEIPRPREP